MASINHHKYGPKDPIRVTKVGDNDLPNCFNTFSSCFDRPDAAQIIFMVVNCLEPHKTLVVSQEQVVIVFKMTNIMKAADPDAICGLLCRSAQSFQRFIWKTVIC